MTMEVFPGITMDPDQCEGKPCIADTAVDVATAVGTLGIGKTFEETQEILNLTYDQLLTALRYASYVTDHLPLRLPTHAPDQGTGPT